MFGPLLIICALLVFAAGVLWIRGNVAKDEDSLITTIDTLLPQTQCAQCGYPGCRPYAQAVAEGAQIDLCPPGGQELVVQLSELMGVEIPAQKLAEPLALIAVIDEAECIGCTLCLPPCPVDAIIGAQGFMHTVLSKDCTGCELCIAPCPVDCITLEPVANVSPKIRANVSANVIDKPFELKGKGCINCGQCAPACPKDLLPDQLLKLGNGELWEQASELNLQDCIECSLCDRVCPSEINLAQFFGHGKVIEKQRLAVNAEKLRIQDRFENHQARLQAKEQEGNQRRQQRMNERLQRLQQSRGGDQ